MNLDGVRLFAVRGDLDYGVVQGITYHGYPCKIVTTPYTYDVDGSWYDEKSVDGYFIEELGISVERGLLTGESQPFNPSVGTVNPLFSDIT